MEQSDLWIDMSLLILERPQSEEWILMIHKKATEVLVQFGRTDLEQVCKGYKTVIGIWWVGVGGTLHYQEDNLLWV